MSHFGIKRYIITVTSFFIGQFFIYAQTANDLNSKKMIKLIHVNGPVYSIEGQGGNIGILIGKDGILLIDDQFAHLHDAIVESISKISKEEVTYVINTHWHVDHTNGNEKFGAKGSTIIAQRNSALRMQSSQTIAVFNHQQKPYAEIGLPKIKFDEHYELQFNEQHIDLIAVNHAHTDGDLIVHFNEANVIHTGDVFVTYGYPFIDTPNGGSIQGVIQALDKILSLCDANTKIIPGHGYIASKKDLVLYKEMLEVILERVKIEKSKGRTVNEILLTNPTRGFKSEKINEAIFVNIILSTLK